MLRCYNEYKQKKEGVQQQESKSQVMAWMSTCAVNANVTNSNIFFITDPQGMVS